MSYESLEKEFSYARYYFENEVKKAFCDMPEMVPYLNDLEGQYKRAERLLSRGEYEEVTELLYHIAKGHDALIIRSTAFHLFRGVMQLQQIASSDRALKRYILCGDALIVVQDLLDIRKHADAEEVLSAVREDLADLACQ